MQNATEQIENFKLFLEQSYEKKLYENASKGILNVYIDFFEIVGFSHELGDLLLEHPEDGIKAIEIAIEQFDIGKSFRARIFNLPKSQFVKIRNIRSNDLGNFVYTEGIVRQSSDVRPKVMSAKFECPSCGNTMSILQLDTKFKEPIRCSCGRRGNFKLLSKDLVDAQRLIVEESPDDLEGGEQPKRLSVFLQEDLVEPKMERKTTPGSKIRITGIIKEVPITLRTGAQSTTYDLAMEANSVIPIIETFDEIEINKDEEEKIKELAKDPKLFDRLINSIAPSVHGYEKIKEALILQMASGVRKVKSDNTVIRGDIHVLLVGDPGAAKSTLLQFISKSAPKSRFVSGKGASGAGLCVGPKSIVLTNPGGMERIDNFVDSRLKDPEEYRSGIWKQENIKDVKIQSLSHNLKLHSKFPSKIWKLKSPRRMFEIILSSGKKIELTGNTQLFSINNGFTNWKKSMELKIGDYIATPRKLIGGEITQQQTIDLIGSNPVIHGIKPFVRDVVNKLSKKYKTTRNLAKKLKINENQLYFHWVNEKARGNIKLNDLKKLCGESNVRYEDKIHNISLYNGKVHKIPEFLSNDFFYTAGLIAGDGDIIHTKSNSYSVRFSNSNDHLHKILIRTLVKEFGLSYDVQKGNKKRPTSTRFTSRILGEIIIKLGIPTSPKSNKIELSNILLHLSDDMLSHFIAGLFDSDGSVCVRDSGSDCIELTTCSEKLARQLQMVLLRYEIHSHLRKRHPSRGKINGNYDKFIIEIRALPEIKKFAENIKLRHPDKLSKLNEMRKKINENTNIDIIPEIRKRIIPMLKEYKVNLRKTGIHSNGLSRKRIQRIVKNTPLHQNKDVTDLAFSDIFWEKIIDIKVKDSEYEYVYDLTVEDSHNFIVNGVLVHNTATVVKDEFIRGWALEGGALVLSNGGIVCIDELDKMTPEDRSAMHEALEQQQVSISKANIQATLRAQTTVLAAANPKMGRFDPYTPIASQIDLPSPLINRFDLIFPVRDIPNRDKDERIASHVLRSQRDLELTRPEISSDFLKKYMAYIKQNIKPELSDSAINEIKKFYVDLRNKGSHGEEDIKPIPISARQLEALVRLSEASAKLRLSKKVTKQDAQRAIDILTYCLMQVGIDPETGKIDIDRMTTGISASQRSRIVAIRELIKELEIKFGKSIPLEAVAEEASKKNISEDQVDEAIERLKREAEVFEPKKGFISKL